MVDGFSSILGPTDGKTSITLGATCTRDNLKIIGSVSYVKIGDAQTTLAADLPAGTFYRQQRARFRGEIRLCVLNSTPALNKTPPSRRAGFCCPQARPCAAHVPGGVALRRNVQGGMSAPAPLRQTSMSPQAVVLLGMLALIWGTSFVANRAALTEVPVLTVVALRVTIAAAVMWAWVLARGHTIPRGLRAWRRFAVMGLLNAALPFSLIVWGQHHIDSGLTAILNASTAIFGVVLASLIFADERLTPRKVVGVVAGFAGVVLAIGPGALAHLDLTSLAQLAVLAASVSYAFAASYSRMRIRGLAPEVASVGMLTCASLWTMPAALLHDGIPTFAWSTQAWAGVLFLALMASAVAYILNYRILALAGAGNLSLVTLLLTPVAIVLGWVVFGEALGWRALAGFGLLASGLLVLNTRLGARLLAERP